MIPQLANMARGRHSHQTVLAALQLLPSQEFAAWPRFLGIESDWFPVTQHVLICMFAHVDVFLRNMYDM